MSSAFRLLPLLAGLVASLVVTGAAAATPTCQQRPSTIVGTSGDDVIKGTSGPDVIVGLGGNDRIDGSGGHDIICGGAGDDQITGGTGDDRLFGNGGDDRIQGSQGDDLLFGGLDDDLLIGGRGRDRLWGAAGRDRCWGEQVDCDVAAVTTTVQPGPRVIFTWTVTAVDAGNRKWVASTWRPDCPVPLSRLRLMRVSRWDNGGQPRPGRLVVHADRVDDIVTAFGAMYDARFPIRRMNLIDVFDGDDDASMRANNTSAFNCRTIAGLPGVWSRHAYGDAVDINPLVNPWVRGTQVQPPGGALYLDRTLDVPGLIKQADVVTEAFASIGWGWGGNWISLKDYQHFSATGG